MAECGQKQKKAEKLIKELEAKTSKSTREAKIKEAEKAVANCKKKAAASMDKYNAFLAVNIFIFIFFSLLKSPVPTMQFAGCSHLKVYFM